MAHGHKFSGQMKNYSLHKPFATAKMIKFGLNPKIQCLLYVELHSGAKTSFDNGVDRWLHPQVSKPL